MDLAAGAGTMEVEVEGRTLRLTNLDKVLWPSMGFTKGRMIEHYLRVAPVLVPHLRGRPVTLWRFPDGVDGVNWFQTQCRGRPDWLPVAPVPGPRGVQRYCMVNDAAALVWAANLGTIELHPLLVMASDLGHPTALVFDLDPGPPAGLLECARVALWLRDELAGMGLRSFVKSSGSLGLHVHVPVDRVHRFERTKGFARSLARLLSSRHPELVVDRTPRSLRAGKVLVDWVQNDPSRSTVAPYSLRGTHWPTASAPVTWDEVEAAMDRSAPESLVFLSHELVERVDRLGDLYRPVLEPSQSLPPP